MWYLGFVEKGIIPDKIIRIKIRNLLRQRLHDERKSFNMQALVDELKQSPIALTPEMANEQHYELPASFFEKVLGKYLKYSCGFWDESTYDLNEAERIMLEKTIKRAELSNGQQILELGCGWGSLSLYMAQKFPEAHITAVSNSHSQRIYIQERAKQKNIHNLEVITEDMNQFHTEKKFDRVVSVEMFEHMRNYQELLSRINGFLKLSGKLFVHIFTHRELAYKYEVKDSSDWMTKYFFTGGIMPSEDLFTHFQDDLSIEKRWHMDGTHYQKTSEAWLQNMDQHKSEILVIFARTYGKNQAVRWWVYWRIFFMACAELWGYRKGLEWSVSHYRFSKQNLN